MKRGKPIIVCSISQSEKTNNVIDIIQQLCPGEEVTFQLAQKKICLDGRKVVFCNSGRDDRLALSDVKDTVYNKDVTEACRVVGKANVAFIVTNVLAADAITKRWQIEDTHPTLVSNLELLLLVDQFDAVDQDNMNKLRAFLNVEDRWLLNHRILLIIIPLLILISAVAYFQATQPK